jgi:hypothetical protein
MSCHTNFNGMLVMVYFWVLLNAFLRCGFEPTFSFLEVHTLRSSPAISYNYQKLPKHLIILLTEIKQPNSNKCIHIYSIQQYYQ